MVCVQFLNVIFILQRTFTEFCTPFLLSGLKTFLYSTLTKIYKIQIMYIFTVACPSGAIGRVAVCAAWLRWSASLSSRTGLGGSLSGYSGICFEIKFSVRHRGFDGVLFNLWPLANTGFQRRPVLVDAWTTGNTWPPAVCACRSPQRRKKGRKEGEREGSKQASLIHW